MVAYSAESLPTCYIVLDNHGISYKCTYIHISVGVCVCMSVTVYIDQNILYYVLYMYSCKFILCWRYILFNIQYLVKTSNFQ